MAVNQIECPSPWNTIGEISAISSQMLFEEVAVGYSVERSLLLHGYMTGAQAAIPVSLSLSYKTHSTDPVRFSVVSSVDQLPDGFREPFALKAAANEEVEIAIPELEIDYNATQSIPPPFRWQGVAQLYLEGHLGSFDASGGEIHCSVFLPPTPIARWDTQWVMGPDGGPAMQYPEWVRRRGISWDTRLGRAVLLDTFEGYEEQAGADKAKALVQRLTISIPAEVTADASLDQILRSLPDEFADAMWLLSFLGQQRVDWYEATAHYYPGAENVTQDYRSAFARRRTWLGFERVPESPVAQYELLADRKVLEDGAFEQMLVNYRALPKGVKDTLSRATMYLLPSYEQAYFEAHLGHAYSALETMVSGLGTHTGISNLLDSGKFKSLGKSIREVVREHVATMASREPMTEAQREELSNAIIKKVPELQRRAFVDQLRLLMDEYKVDAALLFAQGTEVWDELQKLVKRRDIFIHQGQMDEPPHTAYAYDLHRIRRLVELWVFSILGYPMDQINPHALAALR